MLLAICGHCSIVIYAKVLCYQMKNQQPKAAKTAYRLYVVSPQKKQNKCYPHTTHLFTYMHIRNKKSRYLCLSGENLKY